MYNLQKLAYIIYVITVVYTFCHFFGQTYNRQHSDPAIHVPEEEETLIL